MKLIVSKSFLGPIYVTDEFGLGPFDFVLIGPRNIVGMIDGRLATVESPKSKSRRS